MATHDGTRAPSRTPIRGADDGAIERSGMVKIVMRDGVLLPEPEWVVPDFTELKLTYGKRKPLRRGR